MPAYVYRTRRRDTRRAAVEVAEPAAEAVEMPAPVVVEPDAPAESDASVEVPTTPKPRKPRTKKSDE